MRPLIVATILFILSTGIPLAGDFVRGEVNFTAVYESSGGRVHFPHGSHAGRLGTECNFCHSALRTFGGINQMYGHKICGVCHENRGGPMQCDACHDRPAVVSETR